MIKHIVKVASAVGLAGTTLLALTSCSSDGDSEASAKPSVSAGAEASAPSADTSKAADNQGDDASGSGGSGDSGSSSEKSSSGGSGSGSGSEKSSSDKGGSDSGSGGGSGDQDNSAVAKCSAAAMKLSIVPTGGTMPAVYLKATNSAGSTCQLEGYPQLGYEGAQAIINVDEGSRPQAVVMVEPGKSAYATIWLDESGANTHRETSLSVGIGGSSANVQASGSGLAINDGTKVTYWQSTMAEAMGG